jgi:hypothetical protein
VHLHAATLVWIRGTKQKRNLHDNGTTSASTIFSTSLFETLRWKNHAAWTDKERNAQPKVIVDVSAVDMDDEMFQSKAFSFIPSAHVACESQNRPVARSGHFLLDVRVVVFNSVSTPAGNVLGEGIYAPRATCPTVRVEPRHLNESS